jgi:steroid 5-alpha reductase family enzyme
MGSRTCAGSGTTGANDIVKVITYINAHLRSAVGLLRGAVPAHKQASLPAAILIGIVLFLFTSGVFLHYVGDAQKYYTLKLKKGLIEEGLFRRTRNPNYLGEILIYTSFALMALHWLPFLILAGWVLGGFVRNMRKKDRSLSRHPEFDEYRKRTGLLFPKIL